MIHSGNHLSIKQAKEFLSKLLNTELDDQEFFTYCLENNVPIVHKALTEFSVIKGFELTEFESQEWEKHIEFTSTPYNLEKDKSVYSNCNFYRCVDEIKENIYKEVFKKHYLKEKDHILKKELNYYLSQEEIFKWARGIAKEKTNDELEEILNSNQEYLNLLAKREELDKLDLILRSIHVKKFKNKYYAFSSQQLEYLPSGLYNFLDEDLTSHYAILLKLKPNLFSDAIPYKPSEFLEIDQHYYFKYAKKIHENWPDPTKIEGILHEGFLKKDLESSLKSKSKQNNIVSNDQIDTLEEKYLRIIGAILEERKRAAGGRPIQSLIAQNIEEMTKSTGAKLSKSTLEKIFSSANRVFKPFNNK